MPPHILRHLLAKWRQRTGGNAPYAASEIFICSTFVVRMFDDALAQDSPFDRYRAPSRFSVLLPADVVAAPGITQIPC
jgi:hypothetical protein